MMNILMNAEFYRQHVDTDDGRFLVIIADEDPIADPRSEWDGCTDLDHALWIDGRWQFVIVTVIKMCQCLDCDVWHESDRTASLGMVAMGRGDGWQHLISKIISEHPVPDLITEITGS